MKLTKRDLALEASTNVIRYLEWIRAVLKLAPDDEIDETLTSADAGTTIFEMSRSLEGLASKTDEVARNHWLDCVEREAELRAMKVEAIEDAQLRVVARVTQGEPKGRPAHLRFGACFPELALGGEPEDFARAVEYWGGVGKWDRLPTLWKKISKVAVSKQTMQVAFSKPRARGKRH